MDEQEFEKTIKKNIRDVLAWDLDLHDQALRKSFVGTPGDIYSDFKKPGFDSAYADFLGKDSSVKKLILDVIDEPYIHPILRDSLWKPIHRDRERHKNLLKVLEKGEKIPEGWGDIDFHQEAIRKYNLLLNGLEYLWSKSGEWKPSEC